MLYASGFMQAIYESTVSGCNEILQTIASAASDSPLEQWLQLASFNSCCLTELIPLGKAHEALALLPCPYHPNFGTPLYGALGVTFSKVKQHLLADTERNVPSLLMVGKMHRTNSIFRLFSRLSQGCGKSKGSLFLLVLILM